jgi:hypothetical protein
MVRKVLDRVEPSTKPGAGVASRNSLRRAQGNNTVKVEELSIKITMYY